MKNYTPLLKERWDKGWPAFQEYYEKPIDWQTDASLTVEIKLKRKYGGRSSRFADLREVIECYYTPVPEEVACMALKMLSKEKEDFTEIGDYTIHRKFQVDYQDNVNELDISFKNEYAILISWRNAENVQNIIDADKDMDTIFGEHNIFVISGYYEARNFGFNWHKE